MTGFLGVDAEEDRARDPANGRGGRRDRVREAFRRTVDALCRQHTRLMAHENDPSVDGTVDAGTMESVVSEKTLPAIAASLEAPGFSLRHEGHLRMDQNSKVQAEQEAVHLLARPVRVDLATTAAVETDLRRLSRTLMNGLYETFAILVDSRLRVYARVFFRHLTLLLRKQTDAFGTLQMGHKLETLHDIGGQITALAMTLRWQLVDEDAVATLAGAPTAPECEWSFPPEVAPGVFQQPLQFEATMELLVPSPTGQNRTVCVRHRANGTLKGVFPSRDHDKMEIHVEVDTKELLSCMMDQASLMVAEIVETTNEAFCVPEPKLPRGESFLTMPPPLPRKQARPPSEAAPVPAPAPAGLPPPPNGLDLLSKAVDTQESIVIITPDLQANQCDPAVVPPLCLNEHDSADIDHDGDGVATSVDDLSADQCASIVDDVFGGMDHLLLQGPCRKKRRTHE